jgi:hypothetical protein
MPEWKGSKKFILEEQAKEKYAHLKDSLLCAKS